MPRDTYLRLSLVLYFLIEKIMPVFGNVNPASEGASHLVQLHASLHMEASKHEK